MKLVASLVVRNERHRLLETCIGSLLEFVDEIRVMDDFSNDGTFEWLLSQDKVQVLRYAGRPSFYEHEGNTRQRLLDWTLEAVPSHILCVDGDEVISDGHALREIVEQNQDTPVFTMSLEEVWNASTGGLSIRIDGGWRIGSAQLYRAPSVEDLRRHNNQWRILDQPLACGRNPLAIRRLPSRPAEVTLLHFGWTNQLEREQRYQRYVEHDSGAYHARRHLDSIMWPDNKVLLQHRAWPEGLLSRKESILSSVNR